MSSAFLILSLLLLLSVIQSSFFRQNRFSTQEELEQIIATLNEENQDLIGRIGTLDKIVDDLESQNQKLSTQVDELTSAPVIEFSEASKPAFEAGSAKPSTALLTYIQNELVTEIKNLVKRFNLQGHEVQVIGHTDDIPHTIGQRSLDSELQDIVVGGDLSSIESKQNPSSSNAELGLVRALVIASKLKDAFEKDPDATEFGLSFRAYSAGQLYEKSNSLSNNGVSCISKNIGGGEDDPCRRRIEIRFSPPPQTMNPGN
ncbi:MAG: hypothetical protein AAGG02_08165 [Cyanobacteria bacterium P01_H01_bin.15]